MKKQIYKIKGQMKEYTKGMVDLVEQVERHKSMFPKSFVESLILCVTECSYIMKEFNENFPENKR